MDHQIVKVSVPAKVDGREVGFNVERYYFGNAVTPPDSADESSGSFVQVWADGSITLHHGGKSIFLYDDEWGSAISAIQKATAEKRENKRAREAQWLAEHGDLRTIYGEAVDLTINETLDVLRRSEIRPLKRSDSQGHFFDIKYKGEWIRLSRTDLTDDVCTMMSTPIWPEQSPDDFILRLRNLSWCYGARLRENSFSVIDSLTDG